MRIEKTSHASKTGHVLKKTGNILMMGTTVMATFVTFLMLYASEVFIEFCLAFSSPSALSIYKSDVANILLSDEFIVIPAIIVIAMIVKEFRVEELQFRIYINLGLLIAAVIHCGVLSYLLFEPVFNSKCCSI